MATGVTTPDAIVIGSGAFGAEPSKRPSAPTYSASGRINRPRALCSATCAIQPATRPRARIDVNIAGSNPSPCKSSA